MSDIQTYIEKLKIKKVFFGGFDKESVYTSMMELDAVYQKEIVRQREEKDKIENEYLSITNELEQAKNEIERLKFQLDEEQKNQNIYDSRCNALNQAIDAINLSKDKIIEDSKKTAASIIADAYEKSERIHMEYLMQKQQKDILLSKVAEVKQKFGISIDNVRSVLAKILVEVDDLQKVGLEQAFYGDEIVEKSQSVDIQNLLNSNTNQLVKMKAGSVNEYDSRL